MIWGKIENGSLRVKIALSVKPTRRTKLCMQSIWISRKKLLTHFVIASVVNKGGDVNSGPVILPVG